MLTENILLLCLASFSAGFIDSIVGGGGMVQLPALLLALPGVPVVSVLGTNKIISVTGTAVATWRFSRSVRFLRGILFPTMMAAFVASFIGAWFVTVVDPKILRPVFVGLLLLIFALTIRKQNFGMEDHNPATVPKLSRLILLGTGIGFYDGFFGPGTGSLLIIGFVGLLGMTFVQGSAYAKMINLSTNVAAILLFVWKGAFLINVALPLMAFNVLGSLLGVRLALLKGNVFIRGLLRVVVFVTILRLGSEVFFG